MKFELICFYRSNASLIFVGAGRGHVWLKQYFQNACSRMKSLKTATRNSLSQDTLQNLMRVSMYGPPVEQYNPEKDLISWLSKGEQSM